MYDKIEILGRISGIKSFEEAFDQKLIATHEGVKLNVISLQHLIENKKATGRDKDFEDIKGLQESEKRLKTKIKIGNRN